MTKLPAHFVDSAVATINHWWDLAGVLTTSEGARAAMQADLSRKLYAGVSSLPLAYIIGMADHGHVPAQRALAEYIADAINKKRFDDLTPGLQDYNVRVLLKPQLPGYPRGPNILDNWTRDVVIGFLVGRTMSTWRLKKKPAAALVAIVLKRRGIKPASTRQVIDIYDSRDTRPRRLVEFMLKDLPELPEPSASVV
jgi:hypothetical protein